MPVFASQGNYSVVLKRFSEEIIEINVFGHLSLFGTLKKSIYCLCMMS